MAGDDSLMKAKLINACRQKHARQEAQADCAKKQSEPAMPWRFQLRSSPPQPGPHAGRHVTKHPSEKRRTNSDPPDSGGTKTAKNRRFEPGCVRREDLLRTSKRMFFFLKTRRLRWSVTGDFQTDGPWWCCHRHSRPAGKRPEHRRLPEGGDH